LQAITFSGQICAVVGVAVDRASPSESHVLPDAVLRENEEDPIMACIKLAELRPS